MSFLQARTALLATTAQTEFSFLLTVRQVEVDALLGCPKCRWLKGGCGACRERPIMERQRLRWKPAEGRYQDVRHTSQSQHRSAKDAMPCDVCALMH